MALAKLLLVALVAVSISPVSAFLWMPHNLNLIGVGGQNGGTDCVACTLLMAMISQYSGYHNVEPMVAMDALCSLLPAPLPDGCKLLAKDEGQTIAKLIAQGETADVICHSIKDAPCTSETGEMCHIFPLPPSVKDTKEYAKYAADVRSQFTDEPYPKYTPKPETDLSNLKYNPNSWFCKHFAAICNIINKFGNDHLPLVDLDGDGFSTIPTFRGSDWRGKDCSDEQNTVYPGRDAQGGDILEDTNCNGIHGIDEFGQSYEDKYCKNTGSIGTIIFGDSAAAHFHLPPSWFNITEVGNGTYDYLFYAVENELDWPDLSYSTGHFNSTKWNPTINGPMNSGYQNLLELNRCNHRDYQNVGVNGASSRDILTFAKYFTRNTTTDKPAFITLALIGNDVCGSSYEVSSMTPPTEYYANMKLMIEMIDSRVAPGSILATVGLADGRALWDAMWNRTHPIGAYKNDVTYQDLYAYLNCLKISPCSGWMNSNATIRNDTSAHAALLTATLQQLTNDMQGNVTNVKLIDFGNLITEVINDWSALGNPVWELIEPMDGFHPNQVGNWFVGQTAWKLLNNMSLVPPPNPNNADITKKFGDQGGY